MKQSLGDTFNTTLRHTLLKLLQTSSLQRALGDSHPLARTNRNISRPQPSTLLQLCRPSSLRNFPAFLACCYKEAEDSWNGLEQDMTGPANWGNTEEMRREGKGEVALTDRLTQHRGSNCEKGWGKENQLECLKLLRMTLKHTRLWL